jgi:hypothetical protein
MGEECASQPNGLADVSNREVRDSEDIMGWRLFSHSLNS